MDFVTPTTHFDVKVRGKPKMKKRNVRNVVEKRTVMPVADHESIVPIPNVGASPAVTFSLANCYEYVSLAPNPLPPLIPTSSDKITTQPTY